MFNKEFISTKENSKKTGRLYDGIFIPLEFENIILRHVLLNNLKLEHYRCAPLLLLQGKKGEGKTFMTETVLRGNGIFYRIISSSILAGNHENDAVNILNLNYDACKMDPPNGRYSVLVIDDFHLSIAVTRNSTTHTSNAENLLAALMNIADKKEGLKTPIILIGNDFTDAYPPLTRFGRMNICTWAPSVTDKVEIIKEMINQLPHDNACTTTDFIQNFIARYKNQYIGFYEQAIQNVMLQDFSKITEYFASKKGKVNYLELKRNTMEAINKLTITTSALYEEADKLLSNKLEKLDK